MTRSELRILLRKRIHEKDGVQQQWTDAELNLLLNLSIWELQRAFWRSSAASFATVWKCDRKQDKTRTPLPGGFMHELVVEVKARTADSYKIATHNKNLNLMAWQRTSDEDGGIEAGADPEYTILGDWIKILPAPAADVTAGIRLSFARTDSLDDDSASPRMRLAWQEAIIDLAKRKAYGETEEQSKTTEQAIAVVSADIPMAHRESNTGSSALEVGGIDKDY